MDEGDDDEEEENVGCCVEEGDVDCVCVLMLGCAGCVAVLPDGGVWWPAWLVRPPCTFKPSPSLDVADDAEEVEEAEVEVDDDAVDEEEEEEVEEDREPGGGSRVSEGGRDTAEEGEVETAAALEPPAVREREGVGRVMEARLPCSPPPRLRLLCEGDE